MIKEFILNSNLKFIKDLRSSIKVIEIEERLDLVFHRPFGLLVTYMAIPLKLTPTGLSILSLLFGIASGVLFYFQDNLSLIILACILITTSSFFDSADGMLARMTNTSSEVGMIIDGLIDNLVFIAAYLGGTLYFFPEYGFKIFIIAALSGFANSIHALIYDFYKNEVSFMIGDVSYLRNITLDEAKTRLSSEKNLIKKLSYFMHYDYINKQYFFTKRKDEVKKKFEELKNNPETQEEFKRKYKEELLPLMPWWALFGGSNVHRTLIMLFSLFGAFDHYLFFNLIFLSIGILVLVLIQNKKDRKFLESFS